MERMRGVWGCSSLLHSEYPDRGGRVRPVHFDFDGLHQEQRRRVEQKHPLFATVYGPNPQLQGFIEVEEEDDGEAPYGLRSRKPKPNGAPTTNPDLHRISIPNSALQKFLSKREQHIRAYDSCYGPCTVQI